MQICYRCEEKTNEFLEKIARKKGISKNHLIDEIIKNYLKYGYCNTDIFHPDHKKKEISAKIQLANELLIQIIDELNSFQAYIEKETSFKNTDGSFPIFRLHTIQLLLEISKLLETIRKNNHPPDR